MVVSRPIATLSLVASAALVLAGCSSGSDTAESTTAADVTTIEIEDNSGTHNVDVPPGSVVALDNRSFQTLSDWGVGVSAAAVSLMPDTVDYASDDSIVDIGNHREPNLELIAAADPDVIVNGQRFTQHTDAIAALVPDAVIVDLEPRDGQPFDEELRRQTLTLGEIFGKIEEAEALVADFDASIERARAAYDPANTVLAVNTSGGAIGYLAPGVGRTLGPVYDILGLTPALEVDDATDFDQGDEISVEAIAASNPDWILVLDRDAAVSADDPSYSPAAEIIENNPALTGVTAVADKKVVYLPADTYLNEGIQTYTAFFNSYADAMEA